MGLKIFLKAIQLVLNNLGPALRISGLLYLVPTVLSFIVLFTIPAPLEGQMPSTEYAMANLVLIVVQVVTVIWIAVAWHRYVLLDEMPAGPVPPFEGRRILAYFGLSLLLALIAIPVFIAGSVIGGLLAAGGLVPGVLGILVVYGLGLVIGYRFALILPASAVDRPLRLGDAWQATRGASGTIFTVAFLSALAVVAVMLVSLPISDVSLPLLIVWQVVSGWFVSIVGASVLTSLYGVFVEKRAVE